MSMKLGLALAAALVCGALAANAEEFKKTEIVVGQKVVLSDKVAAATFSGVVVGREKAVLKVKIDKVEGTVEWKSPKGETGQVKVGETLAIYCTWEKGEGDKYHPARTTMQLFERLRAGDKVDGGLYFDEHPRLSSLTVTARGEGEKQPEGEKKPEAPKAGGEF